MYVAEQKKWMPFEYKFDPPATDTDVDLNDDKYSGFLDELAKLLVHSKLDSCIGLKIWPGKGYEGGLEITNGKANILLRPDEVCTRPTAFRSPSTTFI